MKDIFSFVVYIFAIIGFMTFLYTLRPLFSLFRRYSRKGFNLQERYGKCWAVVTGATAGMGKSYCKILARKGINICMIARNPEKLKVLDAEVKSKYDIKTRTIIADFRQSTQPGFFDNIVNHLKDLDVGILVNNVGVLENYPFENHTDTKAAEQVIVNTLPQTMFTKVLIPFLKNREHRSAIINMASAAALAPKPGMAIYAATKAFNDFLSRALSVEFKDQIDVISVRPKRVSTKMTKNVENQQEDWHWVQPDEVVEQVLVDLGHEQVTMGHWKHELKLFFDTFTKPLKNPQTQVQFARELYEKEKGLKSQRRSQTAGDKKRD